MNRLKLMERLTVPLMLFPALAIVIVLFGGGMISGVGQSVGYFPVIGLEEFTLQYYQDVLTDDGFFESLWLTFRLAFLSTLFSSVLAVAFALVLRHAFRGSRFLTFMYQIPIPIPHLVVATGIVLLVSQSGLLSRGTVALGLTETPRDFPVMVFDRPGVAIQLTFLWKEVPFIGIVVLAVLKSVGPQYEEIAQTLGANAWQRFRYVLLPLILPGILSTSIIVFAFVFANYEIPLLLGVRHPTTLPVMAFRNYQDPDLALRPQAMAISMILAVVAIALLVAYRWLARYAVDR
ncbi:MAG: ABC transporter permease subunit [Chloroflexi bacterium]|nr:ABC transporter permease subunit [Chloroflexota bacterium]